MSRACSVERCICSVAGQNLSESELPKKLIKDRVGFASGSLILKRCAMRKTHPSYTFPDRIRTSKVLHLPVESL